MPRPYVAATRTGAEDELGAALRATAGALGKPEPNTDQQLESDCAHLRPAVVKYTPWSVATYTVFAFCGSMARLLAGAMGKFAVMLFQVAPPFVERYTTWSFSSGPSMPATVTYTVLPVGS